MKKYHSSLFGSPTDVWQNGESMENFKNRNTNFELLRILSMFMIILFHIQLHGSQPQLNDGMFSNPVFVKRLLLLDVGSSFGVIGNGIFLMLSGYFMVGNQKIDLGKVAKKLLLQSGFATIILTLASAAIITFSNHNLASRDLVGIELFNDSWWYIGYYFFVIVIGKVFLNKFLSKLNANTYSSFLLAIFTLTQMMWSSVILEGLATESRTFLIGIFYYSLGGYISRYQPFRNIKTPFIFLTTLATYMMRFVSNYNITMMNIERHLAHGDESGFIQTIHTAHNHEITAVIIAICIFEVFNRIKLPYNILINYLGKSTLMIYMIHENELFQSYYKDIRWMEALNLNPFIYTEKWILWTICGFAVGVAVYSFYASIFLIHQKLNVPPHKNSTS